MADMLNLIVTLGDFICEADKLSEDMFITVMMATIDAYGHNHKMSHSEIEDMVRRGFGEMLDVHLEEKLGDSN